MKKLLSTALAGVFVSSAALAGSFGPFNNSIAVTFDVKNDAHNYFHCKVNSNKVKHVQMQNHNCLISGFDHDGVLNLSGLSLTKLNHTHFDVIDDPSSKIKLTQNVTITFDGDDPNGLTCSEGKGGRLMRYGFFYGHG